MKPSDTKFEWGHVELALVAELLYGSAHILSGSNLNDDELTQAASEAFQGRAYSVVRHWMILDVMVSSAMEQELKMKGLKPSILYSSLIVHDSQGIHRSGDSILSGYQLDFNGCIFECSDTIFILGGRGARKHVSLPAVQALAAY